jgi:hypothetical protein
VAVAIQKNRQKSNAWIAASACGLLAMTMGSIGQYPPAVICPTYCSGAGRMVTSTPVVTLELSV